MPRNTRLLQGLPGVSLVHGLRSVSISLPRIHMSAAKRQGDLLLSHRSKHPAISFDSEPWVCDQHKIQQWEIEKAWRSLNEGVVPERLPERNFTIVLPTLLNIAAYLLAINPFANVGSPLDSITRVPAKRFIVFYSYYGGEWEMGEAWSEAVGDTSRQNE